MRLKNTIVDVVGMGEEGMIMPEEGILVVLVCDKTVLITVGFLSQKQMLRLRAIKQDLLVLCISS
jgi:hypothetical protein